MKAKEIRKNANFIAIGLLLYTILELFLWTVEPFLLQLYFLHAKSSDADRTAFLERLAPYDISTILTVLICVSVLFLFFRKRVPQQQLFQSDQKMTGKMFCILVCIFMSGQLIFSLFANGINALFQLFGVSAMSQLSAASARSTTIPMFLYSSLFAPLVEEIIYRGFVLRSLQKYGKIFAIVVSATLFGIMHGNLYQMIFAFLVGLVLGYTASTYSIRWSILLHIVNNFIFGDLLGWILKHFSPTVQDYCSRGVNIFFFAIGAWILLRNRDSLLQYIRQNRTEKKCYLHTFTALGILVFTFLNLYFAFSGIHIL